TPAYCGTKPPDLAASPARFSAKVPRPAVWNRACIRGDNLGETPQERAPAPDPPGGTAAVSQERLCPAAPSQAGVVKRRPRHQHGTGTVAVSPGFPHLVGVGARLAHAAAVISRGHPRP